MGGTSVVVVTAEVVEVLTTVVVVVVGVGKAFPVRVLVASLYPLRDTVTVSVADVPPVSPETVIVPELRDTTPADVATAIE